LSGSQTISLSDAGRQTTDAGPEQRKDGRRNKHSENAVDKAGRIFHADTRFGIRITTDDTDDTDRKARVTRINSFHISDIRAIRGKFLVFMTVSNV
jgi:hypothetical protein